MSLKHDLYGLLVNDDGANGQSPQSWSSLWDSVDNSGSASPPAPVQVAASSPPALYVGPGGLADISVADIHQGQIGDCFLLSSIGELALMDPQFISNMIQVNADGTETVTLYAGASGQVPTYGATLYQPVQINVTNNFPSNAVNGGASPDSANGIWVQVLEKALATLDGGYGVIAGGGNPMIPLEELTGQAASYIPITSPSSLTPQIVQSYDPTHDLIVMDTSSRSGLSYNLVSNHAYIYEGATVQNGTTMVQLGNPWGFHQPGLIPLSQLSQAGIVEIDVGRYG